MKWKKTDFKYNIRDYSDAYRGAAVPFALPVNEKENRCRVYYTARDEKNRSNIFYMEMNIETKEIVYVPKKPVLSPGTLGCFDDSGAMMSWIEIADGRYYLYYIGWNLGVTVPFRNSIGLAVSDDGVSFQKMYEGPIMDRTEKEPHFCSSPCVMRAKNLWHMWYLACTRWEQTDDGVKHYYHIKYAESQEGIYWKRDGKVCIDFKDETEYAISRPCVSKINGHYKMWYSYRGERYRIGYAESENGTDWVRKDDEAGIDVSANGFDSDMICYPYVFECAGKWYMLYNGNGFGMTGFGVAEMAEGNCWE